jgi:two-component system response regulator PilR (NtrC family)
MARILVADDDSGVRELLEIMLTREGYAVSCAENGKEALALFRKKPFDLVLTDLKMPKVDGLDLLKEIKAISPDSAVILITAHASGATAVAAMQEGAFDYIEKDFDIEDLKATIRDALAKKGISDEVKEAESEENGSGTLGRMIGKSREMFKVHAMIRKVSDTPANVLILGESGTGKELVARAIHENSSRKQMPFIAINCGGIPENLLESELFGYMKGSFTGAYADRAGLLEQANRGTVFLDEVGDLPQILQVKLLRAVQEKTFRRIGGSEDIKVDVRIISATNKDLKESVQKGTFREDLFYRLNVIPIRIPPLRNRKEDIPILAQYFLEKYSREFGKEIRKISAYALELLTEYPFPGNIRELENIIERSVALEGGNIVLPENLVLSGEASPENGAVPEIGIPSEGINLNSELARIERTLIEQALKISRGSKTKAAGLLKISRDSLDYRIDKLKMN